MQMFPPSPPDSKHQYEHLNVTTSHRPRRIPAFHSISLPRYLVFMERRIPLNVAVRPE